MGKRYLWWIPAAGLIGVAGAATSLLSVFPRAAPATAVVVPATSQRLARGRYLAEHVLLCSECHADRDWTAYSAPSVSPQGALYDYLRTVPAVASDRT